MQLLINGCVLFLLAKRFRVWTVAEIGAVRYPGRTELPLKICDSQPSSPPLAIPGVGNSCLLDF
jgi:hypothetical protein